MDQGWDNVDRGNASGGSEPTPDDPQESLPLIDEIVRIWLDTMRRPSAFFATLDRRPRVSNAVAYYFLIGILAAAIDLFWGFALPEADTGWAETQLGIAPIGPLAGFLATPFGLALALAFGSLVLHGALMLVGGATRGFSTTVRVLAYSASPGLLVVVPVLGGFVGMIWSLVLVVIGLREGHAISGAKALVAVLMPVILLGVLGFFVLVAAVALLFGR